ncbi:MAG: glycoside hydrolase family 38 C-terminal domain-containing protein, partial [Acidobacteriota bacterium]
WNIDADFEDQKWDLAEAKEVELAESGPVRAVLRVVKKFQHSTFVQNVTLYPKIPRVDVRMEADWHEKHSLLKVAFPVAVRSDFATYEIPFGTIRRPTTRRTPEEKAKFEVPALRWADLSDSHSGLSVLNDSKYGYDARDNVLRLTLLRSPTYPDPHADEGFHRFTYSLYPHAGTWKEAGTVRRGYELNYRLLPVVAHPHPGSLPAVHSFLQLEPDNVMLTAVKRAEDDEGLIFRFYEFAGQQTRVRLRLPPGATQVFEVNLMEKEERELPLRGTEVVVPTRPFEIKSVKVQFASQAARNLPSARRE